MILDIWKLIPEQIEQYHICPICLMLEESNKVHHEPWLCHSCGSEAIDVEYVPLAEYIEEHSINDLQEQISKIDNSELLRTYVNQVIYQLMGLIKLKEKLDKT